jgi:hypothetical protein
MAGELCKFYANAIGKQSIHCQLLLVQYKQQANPLLSIHNCTSLVISRNDKNNQLTLLSQRKPVVTARNTVFPIENHWSTKKIQKMAPFSV